MARYDINLRDYWRTIRKRRTIVILSTILFTAFSCLFAFISNPEPRYEATSAVEMATGINPISLAACSMTGKLVTITAWVATLSRMLQ